MKNQISTIYYSFKLLGLKYAVIIFLSIALSIGLMLFAHGFLKGYEKSMLIKIIGSSPHISVTLKEPISDKAIDALMTLPTSEVSLSNKGLVYHGTADISSPKRYRDENNDGNWVEAKDLQKSQSPEIIFKGMLYSQAYHAYLSKVLIPFKNHDGDNPAVAEIYTETSRPDWDGALTYRKPLAFPPSLYREMLDPYLFTEIYPFIRFPEIENNFKEASLDSAEEVEFVVVAALDTPISDETIAIFSAYETTKHVFFGSAQGEDTFNYLEIYLHNPMKADRLSADLKEKLGDTATVSVWSDKYVTELGLITAFNFLLYFVMGGIGVAVGLLMSALLSISVRRKRRQIAVFRALGSKRRFVGNLFLYYSATLGFIGFFAGMALGHVAGHLLWHFSTTDGDSYSNVLVRLLHGALKGIPQPEAVDLLSGLVIFSITLLIAIASAYGPSVVAADVDPVEGLRES